MRLRDAWIGPREWRCRLHPRIPGKDSTRATKRTALFHSLPSIPSIYNPHPSPPYRPLSPTERIPTPTRNHAATPFRAWHDGSPSAGSFKRRECRPGFSVRRVSASLAISISTQLATNFLCASVRRIPLETIKHGFRTTTSDQSGILGTGYSVSAVSCGLAHPSIGK